MNEFKLEIEYVPIGGATIASIVFPPITNNAGGTVDKLSTISAGKRMQWLGVTEIKNGIKLCDERSFPGIVFDGYSSATGAVNVPIAVNGTALKTLTMQFDDYNHEYATEIDVDGILHSNAKNYFEINLNSEKTTTKITLKKWSKPTSPPRITSLKLGFSLMYDNKSIKNLQSESVYLEDEKKPNPGISVQSGKVNLQDIDGDLKRLAENETLKDGLQFTLFLNETVIAILTSKDIDYNTSDNSASINLVDTIESLQGNVVDPIPLPAQVGSGVPLSALELLSKITKTIFQMDVDTRTHLQNIAIEIPFLKVQDEYKALRKFCEMTMCRIFKTRNGEQRIKKI